MLRIHEYLSKTYTYNVIGWEFFQLYRDIMQKLLDVDDSAKYYSTQGYFNKSIQFD